MLPLSEIYGMKATVDDEWRSPLADAVGLHWNIPAGVLRYWRSSAAHVFVIPPGGDARGVLYARFAPAGSTAGRRLRRGAHLHARLSHAGAPVAELVRSRAGLAAELIPTPVGGMAGCVTRRVDGDQLDVDELDGGVAAAWGAALAEFHQAAGPAGAVPEREQANVFARLMGHPEQDLRDAAQALALLAERREPGLLVVGHGDFELDNLRWTQGKATCFDLDECGVMPAAADVASAVRDLLGLAPGAPEHPELLEAFLTGYEQRAGFAVSLEDLQLHRAALAAQQVLEAPGVLDLDGTLLEAAGNRWVKELHGYLAGHYADQRNIVLATAQVLA
ncbi:phosphotransferase [Arthrobacter sp. ZGTC412]|uniref:phosphotransferase n=1 Tax=Arthrobacter sp. ZGTC412 TaxID=2058900 RepID=UPI000CE44D3D|nr:phosphotransferase [Arthrobacter sp. ZGTC412]